MVGQACKYLAVVGCLVICLAAIYNLLVENEINSCSMTYMYEMPQYKEISLNYETRKKFPNYKIFIYDEGDAVQVHKLSGIPVLYLPGNGGSYKQVRSIASVSYRMAQQRRAPFYFDFFSADFDEELTAVTGKYVQTQAEFVIECINKILSLYLHRNPPPSQVILMGHSMGGFVARNLFLQPNFNASWVNYIVTLATPHLAPAVFSDDAMMKMYEKVNSFWKAQMQWMPIVSLSGGVRDVQVWDRLCDIQKLYPNQEQHALWISTEWANGLWSSADHLCIVWCKEIVLNTARSLFEIEYRKRFENATSDADKITVFQKHFVATATVVDTSLLAVPVPWKQFITLPPRVWTNHTFTAPYYSLQLDRVASPCVYKIGPIDALKEEEDLFLTADSVRHESWAFVLLDDAESDYSVQNLNPLSHGIPPHSIYRKMVHLSSQAMPQFGTGQQKFYVLLRFLSQGFPINLQLSVMHRASSTQSVNGISEMTVHLPPPQQFGHVITLQLPLLEYVPHQLHFPALSSAGFDKVQQRSYDLLTVLQLDPWNTSFSVKHWTGNLQVMMETPTHVVLRRHTHSSATPSVMLLLPITELSPHKSLSFSVGFAPVSYVAELLRAFCPQLVLLLVTLLVMQSLLMRLLPLNWENHMQCCTVMAGWIVLHRSPAGSMLPLDALCVVGISYSIWALWLGFVQLFVWLGVLGRKAVHCCSLFAQLGIWVNRCCVSAICCTLLVCLTVLLVWQQVWTILLLNVLLLVMYAGWVDCASGKRRALLSAVLLHCVLWIPDLFVWTRAALLLQGGDSSQLFLLLPRLSMDVPFIGFFVLHLCTPLLLITKKQLSKDVNEQNVPVLLTVLLYLPVCYFLFGSAPSSLLTCANSLILTLFLEAAVPLASIWTARSKLKSA